MLVMSKPDTWKVWQGLSVEGRFPLRQWIGGSDHSAVFLTERQGQPAKAAIKLIAIDPAQADHQLSRLRAAMSLSHPNLLRVFEIGRAQIEGEPFIYVVMEHAEEDLSQILPQRPLTPSEVSDLLPPVLDALSYLHSKGFVHGRIKPSNILAVGDQLKLSADQIARITDADRVRRRRDVYDAPESAAGIVLPVGDVWSVGVTLVAAITQQVAIAEDTAPRTPSLPETIAEPYRGIVRECLQLDPKRRCSVIDIERRLQPPARTVAAPDETKSVLPARANRGPAMAIGAVILALIVIFAFLHFRGSSSSPSTNVQQPAGNTQPAPVPAAPVRSAAKPSSKPSATDGEVTHQVIPDVPKSAQRTIHGTIKVIIEAQVDPTGKVASNRFRLHGSSAYFAGLAQKAAQRWQFAPPLANGQPTASTWLLEFHFTRKSTQASSRRLTR
jgi:serine/threonine protein kinase